MLHSLEVRGFKSLRQVRVELARLVVVFGPNAAGKSNLLEALVLLSRLVGERTLADAFDEGIRGYPAEAFTLPGEGEAVGADPSPTLRLGARMGGDQPTLEYQVEVGMRLQTGQLALVDERLQRLGRAGRPSGNAALERRDGVDGPRFAIRRKSKGSPPYEEKGEIRHTHVSNHQYSGKERFPDFDALRAEVGAWRVVYLDPREAMRRAQPPREVDDIGARGEHLVPFLHRLAHDRSLSKYFDAIVRATRAVIPSVEEVRTDLAVARGEIDLWVKQDGLWVSGRVISEGTLRVLALCAMAANPLRRGLVAFEEPENGVHPRRIEVVTRLLARAAQQRQVVVTTHSPLVVREVVELIAKGEIGRDDVSLLRCRGGPDGTEVRRFEPKGALFVDSELQRALAAAEDADVVSAGLLRGWFDG